MWLVAVPALALAGVLALFYSGGADITVYYVEGCGCCKKYIDYLEGRGFIVEAIEVNEDYMYRLRAGLFQVWMAFGCFIMVLRLCILLLLVLCWLCGCLPVASSRTILFSSGPVVAEVLGLQPP